MTSLVDRKCVLYRVVNLQNGKDYVGISVNHRRRWQAHLSRAASGSRTPFHRALVKYGKDSFEWKVIAHARNFACACALERMARSLGMGAYNLTSGGEGVCDPPPEVRERIGTGRRGKPGRALTQEEIETLRAANTGRTPSDETRKRMSDAAKARKRSPLSEEHKEAVRRAMIGRVISDETREKIRLKATGRRLSAEHVAKLRSGRAVHAALMRGTHA